MSLRNIRKIYGTDKLQEPEEGPEEFEPSYIQKLNKSMYAGLEISSSSEPELNNSDGEPEPAPIQTMKRKKNNKKKRKKQRKNQEAESDLQKVEEVDEVDEAVKAVNAMLGEPEKPLPESENPMKLRRHLFAVKHKYFDAEGELTRRFGPELDDDEEMTNNGNPRRGRRLNPRPVDQNKTFIIPTDKVFKNLGLSMTVVERKDGYIYYAFVHDKEYQLYHQSFLRGQDDPYFMSRFMLEARSKMLVEGMLEFADREYHMEAYTNGNQVIEEIICYMQQIARQYFSFTNIRARLLYKHVENRAFHIALFKHMHMLTNKACHRTALEIGKLLLNLDPSDPLAVLFVIDSIALRAGEYQWLLSAIDYWTKDRDAGFLFNIMYSKALAEYHLAKKRRDGLPLNWKETWVPDEEDICKRQCTPEANDEEKKDEFYKADKLLARAIIQFPLVVTEILKIAGVRKINVTSCKLFDPLNDDGCPNNLKNLMALYARFIWHRFTEEDVLKWLLHNVLAIIEKYNSDPAFQTTAKEYANRRMNLFQTYPAEILRHLSIITPLSNLIVDGAVPDIGPVCSFDPHAPLDGINRYEALTEPSSYTRFFSSILPDRENMDAAMDRIQDLPQEIGIDDLPAPAPTDMFRPVTDSESESDDTEDGTPRHNALAPRNGQPEPRARDSVRFFMDMYDNMFNDAANDNIAELPRHLDPNRFLMDTDEEDEAYILIAQGPPQLVEIEHDSDDDGDPDETLHPLNPTNRNASMDSLEPLSNSSVSDPGPMYDSQDEYTDDSAGMKYGVKMYSSYSDESNEDISESDVQENIPSSNGTDNVEKDHPNKSKDYLPQDGADESPPNNDEIQSNDRELPDLGGDGDFPEDYDEDQDDDDDYVRDRNTDDEEDENEDRDGDDEEEGNEDKGDDEDDGGKKYDEESDDDDDDDFNIDLEEINYNRKGEAGNGETRVVQRSGNEGNNATHDDRNNDVLMDGDNNRDSDKDRNCDTNHVNVSMDYDGNEENDANQDAKPNNSQNSVVEDDITEIMNRDIDCVGNNASNVINVDDDKINTSSAVNLRGDENGLNVSFEASLHNDDNNITCIDQTILKKGEEVVNMEGNSDIIEKIVTTAESNPNVEQNSQDADICQRFTLRALDSEISVGNEMEVNDEHRISLAESSTSVGVDPDVQEPAQEQKRKGSG